MGPRVEELPLHVTVRDDRTLSAPFTSTASLPGLERWDKPAYIQHTNVIRCTCTHVHVHVCILYVYSEVYYTHTTTCLSSTCLVPCVIFHPSEATSGGTATACHSERRPVNLCPLHIDSFCARVGALEV